MCIRCQSRMGKSTTPVRCPSAPSAQRYPEAVKLDPKDPRALTVQIADLLRGRIGPAREFKPGDKFPSLRALADEYNVAELTVHNAVRELQRDGLLVSTSGRGTFVAAGIEETDDPVLAELVAIRKELTDLRDRVETLERDDWPAGQQ